MSRPHETPPDLEASLAEPSIQRAAMESIAIFRDLAMRGGGDADVQEIQDRLSTELNTTRLSGHLAEVIAAMVFDGSDTRKQDRAFVGGAMALAHAMQACLSEAEAEHPDPNVWPGYASRTGA